GDLPEFVDFAFVAQVARVNAASLASMALAPDAPQNVRISSRPSYDTDLTWEPGKDSELAGYEIVWRETTEAVWTHSRPVGKVAAYSVKGLSKDNYFFGVRAVGKNGGRSVVGVPRV